PRRPSPARSAPSILAWRSCIGALRSVPPSFAASEGRQVAIELPAADLDPILLPLLALELHVAGEDVIAERAPHQVRLGEHLDRLPERLRELLDPALDPLVVAELVEVPLHRLWQLVTLLDPLEARVEHRGERQVRVAGGVGAAELAARRL